MAPKMDKFANIAFLTVTESAGTTLTWAQLALVANLQSEKSALIIHRAEMSVGDIAQLNSSGDYVDFGLSLSDRVTSISDLSQPEMLFWNSIRRQDIGTAATGVYIEFPIIRDFTALPGGGLLVPADRLYVGIKGTGTGAAMVVYMRLYYTVQPLATADYWELIEARRVMTT
jgi:hypothetical protein